MRSSQRGLIQGAVTEANADQDPFNLTPDVDVATTHLGVRQLFHRANRLLPEGQTIVSVDPDTPVRVALALMEEHNFSQLPVLVGNRVHGTFSLRSFARGCLRLRDNDRALDLPVDDFVDTVSIVDPGSEIESLLDPLEFDGAVLVGSSTELLGVLTATDVLRYLFDLAAVFVQLQEIEQAVRELITSSASPEQLAEANRRSLAHLYAGREDQLPLTLTDMTFGEYGTTVTDGRSCELFRDAFGGERTRIRLKLERASDLRNDAFHFRRLLTTGDRNELTATRDWLLRRVSVMEKRATDG